MLCVWIVGPLQGTPCPVGAAGGYPVCPVGVILCLCVDCIGLAGSGVSGGLFQTTVSSTRNATFAEWCMSPFPGHMSLEGSPVHNLARAMAWRDHWKTKIPGCFRTHIHPFGATIALHGRKSRRTMDYRGSQTPKRQNISKIGKKLPINHPSGQFFEQEWSIERKR